MAEPLGGYRNLSELAGEWGFSRTYIRRKCVEHGIPIVVRGRASWVAPADRKRLRKLLPPRGTGVARAAS